LVVVPFLSRMSWSTPETYQLAGLRRGTATSNSTRPGTTSSACAIAIMKNAKAAGSVQGLHLVVSDIDAARTELAERGVDPSELFHFEDGKQMPGPDPGHGDYNTFLSFGDPDGNGWMVQEVGRTKRMG
jgi:hypothetical protein